MKKENVYSYDLKKKENKTKRTIYIPMTTKRKEKKRKRKMYIPVTSKKKEKKEKK